MDYVVGSVAALISGNVTPNRPKALKRALTPMKHQPSPNVTPKSELVGDRSIFLSPTTQKKKAIIKKSPKRIFQNPDLDVTDDNEGNSLVSPKADKVKKHLKDELEANNQDVLSSKSPKNKLNKSTESSPKKRSAVEVAEDAQDNQVNSERTPKKKKKNLITHAESNSGNLVKINSVDSQDTSESKENNDSVEKTPAKKKKKAKKSLVCNDPTEGNTVDTIESQEVTKDNSDDKVESQEVVKKLGKKNKKKLKKAISEAIDENTPKVDKDNESSINKENEGQIKKKKNKRRKKKPTKNIQTESKIETSVNEKSEPSIDNETNESDDEEAPFINPNAITSQDTDSEHESDHEMRSDNEESNKAVLDTGPEASSDEEEPEVPQTKKEKGKEEVKERVETEEEVKRTLFVGNVPFSNKCKKEIKKIFSKYGDIETVRIRTVPVKDARVTPKLAVIKNELHPDRSTVNVYIKYKHPSSVSDALVENNTVLNDHHLRVARSDVTGSEHDPKCSIFVGNLPFALEDEALRAKFDKCGDIESVRIIRDKKTNAGKGFGYVNFTSKDGVELALALTEDDLTIKNRILRVKRCTQPTTNKQNPRHNQRQNQSRPQNQGRFNDRGPGNRFGNDRFNHRGGNDRFNQRGGNDRGGQMRPGNRFGNDNRGMNNRGGQMNRPNNRFGNDKFNQRGGNDRGGQMNRPGRFGNDNQRPNNRFGNDRSQGNDQSSDGKGEGAYRRIMNKRKPEDGNDGPPNKRQKDAAPPNKEKKPRKEFVGITAEKKKFQKKKLNKDGKKKKVLSEILTK